MTDLEQRFRTLDRLEVPDLRGDILYREPRPPRREIPWARLGAALVASAVAAAGIAVASRAFFGERPPEDRPGASGPGRLAVVGIDEHYVGQGADKIFAVNEDGTGMELILEGRAPAWSPDGTRISFRRGNPGKGGGLETTIYVADSDGTDVTTVTPDTYGEASGEGGAPVWSPNGHLLAFDTLGGIYVIQPDGSGLRRVSMYEGEFACYDLQPSWSPDGTKLVFAALCDGGNEGIWTVTVDGSDRTQLLAPDKELVDLSQPVWSPDGTRIAFRGVTKVQATEDLPASQPGPGPVTGDYRYDIWVMNADGTGRKRLTDSSAVFADPAWSPDGSEIAYTDWTAGRVVVMNADGTDPRSVTSPEIRACCAAWRPAPARVFLAPG